jgi:hypothetical protein
MKGAGFADALIAESDPTESPRHGPDAPEVPAKPEAKMLRLGAMVKCGPSLPGDLDWGAGAW